MDVLSRRRRSWGVKKAARMDEVGGGGLVSSSAGVSSSESRTGLQHGCQRDEGPKTRRGVNSLVRQPNPQLLSTNGSTRSHSRRFDSDASKKRGNFTIRDKMTVPNPSLPSEFYQRVI